MQEIKSIGFALDPNNIPAFLLDWEVTKKCNLDCSYCTTGLEGGHDNTTEHPPLAECLQSLDFMYAYTSLLMTNKKPTQRKVVLNVYGGESLFHPDIVEILKACREKYQPYKDQWELTVTTTTNAVVNKSIWAEIIPLIDEYTVSYHAENLPKQEKLFFDNLLELKQQGKRVKVVVMMHNDLNLWPKSVNAVEFCRTHGINFLAKPFDQPWYQYTPKQFEYLKEFWISTTNNKNVDTSKELYAAIDSKSSVTAICEGRACCGGRKLSLNNDLKSSVTFVTKQGFQGWYCSVNWFFLAIRQLTGEIFFNKDCRMAFTGRPEPIGNMDNHQQLLIELKQQIETKTIPVIRCAKPTCRCGYCAPKAEGLDDFKDLIKRHVITDVINYE